jgi:5-methyltetrahydrofolate--homocysteine methyltransferase
MDGAMGTELQRAGIQPGECFELWNLTQALKVRSIHQAYVDAGADCLLTHTFQANQPALARHGLVSQWEEILQAAVANARATLGTKQFLVADLGPDCGVNLPSAWRQSGGDYLAALGAVDALLLETACSRDDLISLWFVRKEAARVPFLFSLAYGRNPLGHICTCVGRFPESKAPEFYAEKAKSWHVDALGVNCGRGIGMDDLLEIVRRYRQATDLPLFVRLNAGTPARVADQWVYPLTPEILAERLPELLECGVAMVGGCCGTTPDHIAACRPIIDQWNGDREKAKRDKAKGERDKAKR